MEIYRKNAGRKASLRSQNAHGHVTSAILCGNLQENAGRKYRVTRFVRARAVKMHMDMSQAPQEPFCAEIYKENAERQGYDVDQPAGPNTYRKNPSVWPHCLGKKKAPPPSATVPPSSSSRSWLHRPKHRHGEVCRGGRTELTEELHLNTIP